MQKTHLTKRALTIFLSVLVALGAFSIQTTQANSVSNVTDLMSDQTVNASANHTLTFTTPSGASEGETIAVTFPSSFDTSTLNEDDVDISEDGVDLTTAATCAGSEHASVTIGSDVVTITICAGDGGAIAASGVVVIEIGTNATASGTGVNQIVNAAAVTSYLIGIGGTFADTGSIAITLLDDGTISVTGTVPEGDSGGGSGGGGGGGGGDGGGSDGGGETPADETPADETPSDETPADETPSDEETPSEETPSGDGGEETSSEETSDEESSGGSTSSDQSEEESESGGGSTNTDEAVNFLAEEETVELTPSDETVDAIPNEPLNVVIPTDSITGGEVETITITVDGTTYIIDDTSSENDLDAFRATIDVPSAGDYEVTVHVEFTDGSSDDQTYTLHVVDLGYVYEILDGAVARVEDAVVTLWVSENGSWQLYDVYTLGEQANPTASRADGTFAWYVGNGVYRVEVSKSGYQDAASGTFVVANNIATVIVRISRQAIPLEEILNSDLSTPEKAAAIVEEVSQAIGEILGDLRSTPEVQVGVDIAVPAVIALTIGSAGLLAGLFNLWPLLQYLVTSPILFFWKRRRRTWGVVYNAANKLPIDLAIVRLYKNEGGALVATRVTDKKGRYFFLTQPGEYRLVALKPGFDFPSRLLEGVNVDGDYLDVYHGEVIQVSEKNATVAANIPLDPADAPKHQQPGQVVLKRLLRRLQNAIAFLGCFLALGILIIRPSWLTLAGFLFQIIMYALSFHLTRPRKPKSWGIVYEAGTRRTLGNTVVRIFEPKYNKLLETAVTDGKGRYSFLVGPAQYFTTYEKPGYQKTEVRPIDKSGSGESEVAIDVELPKNPS